MWHEKDYDGELLLLSPVWQLFFESLKQDRESASTLFCPFKLHFRVDGSTEEKRGTKDFQEGAFETFFLTKSRGWPAWNLELESGLYISIFYLEKATETFDTFPTFANDILKTLKIIAFNFFVHFLFCSALISKGKVFH